MTFTMTYCNFIPDFDGSIIFGNAPVLVPMDEVLVPALTVDLFFSFAAKIFFT